eukprot:jgi/Galph1/4069/GphlegSOOS_G2780.1
MDLPIKDPFTKRPADSQVRKPLKIGRLLLVERENVLTALTFSTPLYEMDMERLSLIYSRYLQDVSEFRAQLYEQENSGDIPYRTMSWNMAYYTMTAETVALGVLSLPSVFSTLGYFPGVLLIVFFGILSTYTGYNLGQFRLNHPEVCNFGDAGYVLKGKIGRLFCSFGLWLFLIFLVGSHCLAGSIAVGTWSSGSFCRLLSAMLFALFGFILSLPRTLRGVSYMSILSVMSVCCALVFTGICLVIQKQSDRTFVLPKAIVTDTSFTMCIVAVMDVIFAYAGHLAFFNFIAEMRDPKEFNRALFCLQLSDTTIYLLTGIVMYTFAGGNALSPVISSIHSNVLRNIAYGIATPMIIIAGVIYAHVAAKFIFFRLLPMRYAYHFRQHSFLSWVIWSSICAMIWFSGWFIAEAIPFFNELLSLTASLYASQFTYGLSGAFWLFDNQGRRRQRWRLTLLNVSIVALSVVIIILGAYSSIVEIIHKQQDTKYDKSFSCYYNEIN